MNGPVGLAVGSLLGLALGATVGCTVGLLLGGTVGIVVAPGFFVGSGCPEDEGNCIYFSPSKQKEPDITSPLFTGIFCVPSVSDASST